MLFHIKVSHFNSLPLIFFSFPQQYSSFQTDKLECSQVGNWRSSPAVNAATIQEQNFHSENSELLYAPSYSLPFSYHYGHFPVDSHVFSSKKQMLPPKFGQSQGAPCEVARFFLSTLQTNGECQWHYANSLVPNSQSPSKNLPEQPVNIIRHNLGQSYEGGCHFKKKKKRKALECLGNICKCNLKIGNTKRLGNVENHKHGNVNPVCL